VLKRYYAANIPYLWEERGFRMDVVDVMDGVVIWHGGAGEVKPFPGADAKISLSKMEFCSRARIESFACLISTRKDAIPDRHPHSFRRKRG